MAKDAREILAFWEKNIIDYKRKTLVMFCGTGWRAAESMLYCLQHGIANVCLLSGVMDWMAGCY